MSSNLRQKEYNAAYRRRGKTARHIEKLSKLIQESNDKDVGFLLEDINNLWWKAANKIRHLGDIHGLINEKGEVEEEGDNVDEEIESMNRKFGCFAVGRYYCPACKNLGYLFSPNLNADEKDLELYILHLNFPLENSTFCKIPSIKRHLLMIEAIPDSGVLTKLSQRSITNWEG